LKIAQRIKVTSKVMAAFTVELLVVEFATAKTVPIMDPKIMILIKTIVILPRISAYLLIK